MTLPTAPYPVYAGNMRPVLLLDTITILRTQSSTVLVKGQLSYVFQGSLYFWNPDSTDPDDGRSVIKPDNLSETDPGRWNQYSSTGIVGGA